MEALDAAEAWFVSHGVTTLKPRLIALFVVVYTLPAWLVVAATSGVRRRLKGSPSKKDASANEIVRLTNRAIASTTMYFVPAVICLRNLHVWNPWAGGKWDTPLSDTQLALLHMQSMYYVMDMPYTLLKRDAEQVVHHLIGFGLAVPACLTGGCALPMCATLFTEQVRARGGGGGVRCRRFPRRRLRSWFASRGADVAPRAPASGCGTRSCSDTFCTRTTRWSSSSSSSTSSKTLCFSSWSTARSVRCERPPLELGVFVFP